MHSKAPMLAISTFENHCLEGKLTFGDHFLDSGLANAHVRFMWDWRFISHKVLLKPFCKSQFPHKSVNLFFILVIVKDKLTDLWGS